MRNLYRLNQYRLDAREVFGNVGDATCGAFRLASPIDSGELHVVASSDGGWDHVSVSRTNRCPNWPEMEFIKRAFFEENETAMQLHVPPKDHINHHPFCLHLWRPIKAEIPRPPGWMVGPVREKESA